jgi:anti-sigma factor ChrR (cupin superfamily)
VKEKARLTCSDFRELAPSYALGALDADEEAAFEKHLRLGCPACEAELRAFEDVAAELGQAVAQEPPADLRQRLLSKLAAAPRVPGTVYEKGGVVVFRPDEMAWRNLLPGIQIKLLSNEPDRRYSTTLVRMDPGTRYPRHRHADVEEIFLLSGDLHLGDDAMRPGDYCRAEAGSIHGETYSVSGCVFLLRASRADQLLA